MIHLDTNFLIDALVVGSVQETQLVGWLSAGQPFQISAMAWGEFLCGPLSASAEVLARQLLPTANALERDDAEKAVAQARCERELPDFPIQCLLPAQLNSYLKMIARQANASNAGEPKLERMANHDLARRSDKLSAKERQRIKENALQDQAQGSMIPSRAAHALSGLVDCVCGSPTQIPSELEKFACTSCSIKIAITDLEQIYSRTCMLSPENTPRRWRDCSPLSSPQTT